MSGRDIANRYDDVARIWKDPWDEDMPLHETYPDLYNIYSFPDYTIQDYLNYVVSTFFRRRPFPSLLGQ